MINRYVRRMLDENGTEVVRANYIKELAVATLSKDRHRLIQFNNGEASLGGPSPGKSGAEPSWLLAN